MPVSYTHLDVYKRQVQGICEYLYVLNFGRLLAEGTPDKVLNDPAVIKAYLGD